MTTTETTVTAGSGVSEISTEKLIQDFRTLAADLEQLLKATADVSGQHIAAARVRAEESLRVVRARLAGMQASVVARTKVAAKASDEYVRANPWRAVGTAAAVGVVVGVLVARR